MIAQPHRARMAGAFALVALAILLPAPAAPAGPISEILARHRMNRRMRIPPMEKPFSGKPIKDLNAPSLARRFQSRFALRRDGSSVILPMNRDQGVVRTKR